METNQTNYYSIIIKYILVSLASYSQIATLSTKDTNKISKKFIKQYNKMNQSLSSIYYFMDLLQEIS